VSFENGALGTVEATRFAAGRKNPTCIEINGEKGSMRFNLERMNELEVFWIDDSQRRRGLPSTCWSASRIIPWWENWWPQGHMIGWEHTFVHEITHLLDCIVNDKPVSPHRRHLRGRLPLRRDLRRRPGVGGGAAHGGCEVLARTIQPSELFGHEFQSLESDLQSLPNRYIVVQIIPIIRWRKRLSRRL
jgi:hypothetical protein